MSANRNTRFPKRAQERFADVVLRQVYQSGGRDRYVPMRELEDALGLEPWRIIELCRTRLRGELHVSWRLPAEVEESVDCFSPVERLVLRACFPQPHVRVRSDAVRLTEEELLEVSRARRKKKHRKKHK